MKIEGKTIPAPQNIKRRETFLLQHKDSLPKTYLQAQLLKIAMTRAEKKLRWEQPLARLATQEQRQKETAKIFTPVETPKIFMNRTRDWIDRKFKKGSQRGS